jgi:DNA-binding LytR/AlgR family response regulator
MSKASIVIVEDEALIADHIEQLLIEEGYEVLGIFDTAEDTLAFFKNNQANIVLLDINLGGSIDGVDIANQLNKLPNLSIVFLTSNTDKKTIDRVKLTTPAGFITKPFTKEDIISNIEIALYKSTTIKAEVEKPVSDSFFIKDKSVLIKIFYSDIHYAEAMDNYSIIYLENKKHIVPHTLKSLFELLEPFGFIKTHRSYIVNSNKISAISPKSVIIDKTEIPLSENHRSEVVSKFNLL